MITVLSKDKSNSIKTQKTLQSMSQNRAYLSESMETANLSLFSLFGQLNHSIDYDMHDRSKHYGEHTIISSIVANTKKAKRCHQNRTASFPCTKKVLFPFHLIIEKDTKT